MNPVRLELSQSEEDVAAAGDPIGDGEFMAQDPARVGVRRPVGRGELAGAFEEQFGIRPLEGYGCTECAPAVAVNMYDFRSAGFRQVGGKRGKIGHPLPGMCVRIVDPDNLSPREALDTLVHLNNKYALDGRNPNSYGGIFWCFGRYDRPWPPERPIFGTVRYMSSENTARKLEVRGYLQRFGPEESLF